MEPGHFVGLEPKTHCRFPEGLELKNTCKCIKIVPFRRPIHKIGLTRPHLSVLTSACCEYHGLLSFGRPIKSLSIIGRTNLITPLRIAGFKEILFTGAEACVNRAQWWVDSSSSKKFTLRMPLATGESTTQGTRILFHAGRISQCHSESSLCRQFCCGPHAG